MKAVGPLRTWRRTRNRTLAGSCAVLLMGVASSSLSAQPAESDFRPIRVLGAQRVITDFPVRPVGDVGETLNPSELVLGVTVGEQSRAYPINMLTGPSREILNDTLGGLAIAATW